jgi:hypothetical protein
MEGEGFFTVCGGLGTVCKVFLGCAEGWVWRVKGFLGFAEGWVRFAKCF